MQRKRSEPLPALAGTNAEKSYSIVQRAEPWADQIRTATSREGDPHGAPLGWRLVIVLIETSLSSSLGHMGKEGDASLSLVGARGSGGRMCRHVLLPHLHLGFPFIYCMV